MTDHEMKAHAARVKAHKDEDEDAEMQRRADDHETELRKHDANPISRFAMRREELDR